MTEDLESQITQLVGEASVCWHGGPGDAVFDEQRALSVVRRIMDLFGTPCGAIKPRTGEVCRRPKDHHPDIHISDPLLGIAGPVPLGRSAFAVWEAK